ncbi:MAG: hypothetical protein WAT19_03175 [Ferruginibacter sp.]
MKKLMCIIAAGVLLIACSKDKFNTVPEIKFKSLSPDFFNGGLITNVVTPQLTIKLTDAEGDFGDTSYVYVKNLRNDPVTLDSILFPEIVGISKKNLDVNVTVDFKGGHDLLRSPPRPLPRPYYDTVFYEVYVKDQAKNKSNIISVGPVYLLNE